MSTLNKEHWYDGWFYEKLIAPNQDGLFAQIKVLIEPNSKIIDVGCGTGRFSFSVADKCKSILGIDLSKRNVERANLLLSKQPNDKISFQHNNVNSILADKKEHFDYAVITYVIHEVDDSDRINLLKDMAQIADKIIVGDYLFPQPNGLGSVLNEVVEYVAGKEHYRNYKSYLAGKGIAGLAENAQLKITKEIKDTSYTSHVVVLE
ncbi:MAG: class I SAM-dependent methyltransferase [Melioribacteraceae bacterium]